MRAIVMLLLAGWLAGSLVACTADLRYASGRNAQRVQCMQLPDLSARERCLRDAAMSHDTYQKETDAARH